jgi:hypothetical protein
MNDVEYEVRIGDSDEDFSIAVRAMRSWKMCDALRSTGVCPCLNIHCRQPNPPPFDVGRLAEWLDPQIDRCGMTALTQFPLRTDFLFSPLLQPPSEIPSSAKPPTGWRVFCMLA